MKIIKGGYVFVKSKDSKYYPEHRIIMEKFIKRKLKKEERIHHINENKRDNKIENLMLFPNQKEHARFHTKVKQFGFTQPIITQLTKRWEGIL